MAVMAGGRSAWDFLNPKNWVVNKSLEQNVREFTTGTQIISTVFPEAIAYKLAGSDVTLIPRTAAKVAATQATTTTGGAALGAGAGLTAASVVPLATLGIKTGAGIYGLEWLQRNWWIPALFIGGFIALKYLDKKKR